MSIPSALFRSPIERPSESAVLPDVEEAAPEFDRQVATVLFGGLAALIATALFGYAIDGPRGVLSAVWGFIVTALVIERFRVARLPRASAPWLFVVLTLSAALGTGVVLYWDSL